MHPHLSLLRVSGAVRRILFGLFAFFLLLVPGHAQSGTGSLSGTVSATSGQPLSGVRLTIGNLEATSGDDGGFYFGAVPVGKQTVTMDCVGLDQATADVEIEAGMTAVASLTMEILILDTITIEGSRAGMSEALGLQRAALNLTESIASDAIGRFPDQNAAESLQRMSGVALERDQGEGRFVSIRGLSADLNNTQLNGINIPSSEMDTRKVNLDVISSEMLDGVEMTKAVTPDMDGDAIGGSLNLKTRTAFSSEGRTLQGSLEGQKNKEADSMGYKYSLTWGEHFMGDRLGLLISFSDQRRIHDLLNNQVADPWAESDDGVWYPDGDIDIREYTTERKRRGLSWSVDFRPNADKNDAFFFRGMLSRYSDYERRYREIFKGGEDVTTPISDTEGVVASTEEEDATIEVDLKDRVEDNNIDSFQIGGEHRRGVWEIDYIGAYSHAELPDPDGFEPVFESEATGWNYDLGTKGKPVLTGDYQSLTPADFSVSEVQTNSALQQDTEYTVAINVKREMQWAGKPGFIKFGAKYRAREKEADTDVWIYEDPSVDVTLDQFYRPSTANPAASPFLTIDGAAMRPWFKANSDLFEQDVAGQTEESFAEDFVSHEDVAAAYLMGTVTIGRMDITAGVRVEHTKFDTTGYDITIVEDEMPIIETASLDKSYTNVLPGLHLKYKVGDRSQIRGSVTKTLARPNFFDSSFRRTVDEDDNVSAGNPELDPYTATNFDLSFEYYPKSLGVFSVGVFRKEIDDYIFSQVLPINPDDEEDERTIEIPLNADSATINGAELTWQQQFTKLPSPLDGLGLQANLTLTDANAGLGDVRVDDDLPPIRQSEVIANLAVAYEKYDFMVRVALNYRSKYLEEIGEDLNEDLWVDDHMQIDISSSYKINDRFTIFLDATNINQRPARIFWGESVQREAEYEWVTWTVNAGLRFRL